MSTNSNITLMGKLSTNCMGTASVELKLPNMRKVQEFTVYPLHDPEKDITIQSDTRFGKISLSSGKGIMSQPHSSGAYAHHLALDKVVPFQLSPMDLQTLKMYIFTTASSKAGTNGVVYTDNSGARSIFDL